ncbi:MAG TPA: protease pro-enzyme activation domain-containing protein [Bryobacteraceae bacterium]|nr:protease pro-enzyme activation domain-containing protein [Bryobacteraceae bacterium]
MPKTSLLILFGAVCLTPVAGLAQPSRIAGRIDNTQRITLAGHVHPQALPQYDQGAVDPNMVLPRVTVELKRSAAQQAALEHLLAEQQDPASPNYHKWLTPQQFAAQFGANQDDINKIEAWLQSQNLQVTGVAQSRNAISVSGTAAAVEKAFGTQLHRYVINGESHFANATNPSIPAAFSGVIGGVRGLNDFRLRARVKPRGMAPGAKPDYTDASGDHYLAPEDIATIYNLKPLYNAGLNGAGQSIVVVGQTDIRTADIQQFRSAFNLPAMSFPAPNQACTSTPCLQQVLAGPQDPGIVPPCTDTTQTNCGDLSEADLDIELAGAVAPNATVIYVYSTDVLVSAQYAIDQNLAPVLSMSYGDCEYAYQAAEVVSLESLAQQANAEGITWFSASGDSGATDCVGDPIPNPESIISVDVPASIPEVTGVGGTEFSEGTGNYWNATNDAGGGSATGYIPEIAWNDSAADGSPSASGGGASIYFAKPSWQTGAGVPADGARDVPDVSISASADHDGYIIYSSDYTRGGCPGTLPPNPCQMIVGGTSTGAPTFAGMFALVNQHLMTSGAQATPGLGNINPQLYSLAQSTPAGYHDVTTGNNIVSTCRTFQRGCDTGSAGFNAGPGYDQVTGIGTVDAGALLTAWKSSGGGGQITPASPSIAAIVNAASYKQAIAPGELISIFGSQLAPGAQSASNVPLPISMQGVTASVNNVPAYLLYVSPNQINLQVPYETPAGNATVTISNNGHTASAPFTVAAAAPGIFVDASDAPVPNATADRGQTVTLFITGAGAVMPAVADGAAPAAGTPIANLPAPAQPVTVTIGGVNAPTTFVGIPMALVGVVQVNYTVPANVPTGQQPVVVTVGGVATPAAMLTVQ